MSESKQEQTRHANAGINDRQDTQRLETVSLDMSVPDKIVEPPLDSGKQHKNKIVLETPASEKPFAESEFDPKINGDSNEMGHSVTSQQLAEEQWPVKLKKQPRASFQSNYADASFLNKCLYIYGGKLVAAVNANEGTMTQHMLEKMNKSTQYDTDRLNQFNAGLARRVRAYDKKQMTARDWYKVTRGAFFGAFGWDILAPVVVTCVGESVGVWYSWYIGQIITFLRDPDAKRSDGLMMAAFFALAVFFTQMTRNWMFFLGFKFSMNARKVLMASMYDKVGRLSLKSVTETNSGKLIALISADWFAIEKAISISANAFAAPLVNAVCYAFIGFTAGWLYALIVFGVWVLMILVQMYAGTFPQKYRRVEGMQNDERMKHVVDMVTGIRTIKAYGWEQHYVQKIEAQRAKQLKTQYKINLVASLGLALFQNFGMVAVLLILTLQWYQGQQLTMGESFALVAMVYNIFMQVNTMAYAGLVTWTQVLAVLERLSEVFAMEERTQEREEFVEREQVQVKLEGASYTWGFRVKENQQASKKANTAKLQVDHSELPVLSEINLDLRHDSLLVVVGRIGSGKTTLLYSVMEETIRRGGSHTIKGKIAYVEQEPFIYSATIEDNICFGLEVDRERFKRAVSAAQLVGDLPNFSNGWKTVIGERGINISGGQKARISLARAIYQDADIYLLDDPLSAVDPAVANGLFEKAILGALKNKCVILVTHQLQFLRQSPQILVLQDGRQKHLGTFEEISEQGFDADEILQQYGEQGGEEKEQEDLQALTLAQQLERQKADDQEYERNALRRKRSLRLLKRSSTIISHEQAAQSLVDKSRAKAGIVADAPEAKDKKQIDLIEPEVKMKGGVRMQDYVNFMSFGAGWLGIVFFLFINFATSFATLVPSYILSRWTALELEDQKDSMYPKLFGGFIVLYIILSVSRAVTIFSLVLQSISRMHACMVRRVARAKILFFDSNPLGRILTHFSKDVAVFDNIVARLGILMCVGLFRTIVSVATVCVINPWLLIVMAVAVVLMVVIVKNGKQVQIESQRLDSIYRGPIHSMFANLVTGLVTIRVNNRIGYFREGYENNLQLSTNASFCWLIAMRWMSIRLDMIAAGFIIACTVFTVFLKDSVEVGLLAVSLQVIVETVFMFSVSIRLYAEIENYFTSSQRIYLYCQLEQEDELEKEGDSSLKARGWPMSGKIEYQGATMRYREQLEPSIKNLSFKALPGMKVGVVGRTGSGKSSVLQTLFRLVELEEGTTKIDGVDIKNVGLHLLRQHIAYIPQNPFLLQGSIRENLDPFGLMSDEQVWEVIDEVNLRNKIEALEDGIYTYVSESNSLFSAGQKQLVCLARAIIRKTKILVLDEATANVDLETDNFIQRMLRERFQDCTVIIVAHRLATIIDADRILVMKDGEMVEFNHPYRLLVHELDDETITNTSGHFARSVLATGVESAYSLFEIAKRGYKTNNKYKEDTSNTLSLVDNRTGMQYVLNIRDNAIEAQALAGMRNKEGIPIVSCDPALQNTVTAVSKISYTDGERGILEYRGIPINQLVSQANTAEVAFLLIYGQLPTKGQLESFKQGIAENSVLDKGLEEKIQIMRDQQPYGNYTPITMIQSLLATLSHTQANERDESGPNQYSTQESRNFHIHRILGLVPTLAAAVYRVHTRQELVISDKELSYQANFLQMVFGTAHDLTQNPEVVRAFDQLMILQAEHELENATAALRHYSPARSDVYSSLSCAATAFSGQKLGGSVESVIMMLDDIGTPDNVPGFLKQVKEKRQDLVGFGHRVYKTFDPRASLARNIAQQLIKVAGTEPLFEIAVELEKRVLDDEYFTSQFLFPNLDLYSGCIYKAIGFPSNYMPVLAMIPQILGWVAHWNEVVSDTGIEEVQPKMIYNGQKQREFTPVEEREGAADYKMDIEVDDEMSFESLVGGSILVGETGEQNEAHLTDMSIPDEEV